MNLSIHFEKGWRLSVGIILLNKEKKIFMGERIDNKGAWQMPQGGVNLSMNEDLENAAKRELFEETGVQNIKMINKTKGWYYYHLPDHLRKRLWGGKFLGQKQKWFLFNFEGKDEEVNLNAHKKPEFYNWKWVEPRDACEMIVNFKKKIYMDILKEFKFIVT